MYTYTARRVLLTIPVLIGAALVVFLALHLAPGDPAELLIGVGDHVTEESVAELRTQLGLDRPLPVQFGDFLWRAVRLDFGRSISTNEVIGTALLIRYRATLELASTALLLSVLIAIPIGMISAIRRDTFIDHLVRMIALTGICSPSFWVGIMFMLLFSLRLGWLPVTGRGGTLLSLEGLRHLVLPAVTLGLVSASLIARLTRSNMLEVLRKDYIRTARSKGLSERVTIYKHALKNALLPVITVLGLNFGQLLAGAVVVERVFAWPGIGQFLLNGINTRDFIVVQSTVLAVSVTFVVINLVVDIFYGLLDPRISYN